ASDEDMIAQFNFITEVRDKLTEIHKALKNVAKVKSKINDLKTSLDKEQHKELLEFASTISKEITKIENNLYQTKSKSNQDPLNFPIKLNNKLGHLNSLTSLGNYRPTDQAIEFKNEITKEIDKELAALYAIFNTDVKELNKKVKESAVDLIQLDD
ncbi:MAG: glycosyl hydrolase, partial [Flavobacteriaceae bacterium]|nr:glycosyl hydrolase [Flavobacteriaceae bacterium]